MGTLKTQPSAISIDVDGDATTPESEWSNEDKYWAWETEGYAERDTISSEYSAESSPEIGINEPRHTKRLQCTSMEPKIFSVASLISVADGSTSLSVVSVINKRYMSVF